MSDEISKFTAVMTLQNQRLQIEATNFGFEVNGADLRLRNTEVSNDVSHGINAVLFPEIVTEAV